MIPDADLKPRIWLLVIYRVNVPRRKVKIREKQDTSWELTKKGCCIREHFGLILIPQETTESYVTSLDLCPGSHAGVWVWAWGTEGGSADVSSPLHSSLSAFLSQGSFGHKSEIVPQACLSKRKCTKLVCDYDIPHKISLTAWSY